MVGDVLGLWCACCGASPSCAVPSWASYYTFVLKLCILIAIAGHVRVRDPFCADTSLQACCRSHCITLLYLFERLADCRTAGALCDALKACLCSMLQGSFIVWLRRLGFRVATHHLDG